MRDAVDEAVDEDEPPCDFVEVNVSVERQEQVHPELAELRDRVTEHQHQDEHGREVQTLA